MYYEWSGQNLAQAFDHTCREHADNEALVVDGDRLSYRELQDKVFALTAALQKCGVGSGSRVASLVDASLEFATMVLALHRLGAVLIPLNLTWTAREYIQAFQLTDPDILITREEFRGNQILTNLEKALPNLAGGKTGEIDVAEAPTLRTVITVGAKKERPYAQDFADLCAAGDQYDRERMLALAAQVDPEQPVLTLPTSGSTGFPKPVVHSHNSFLVNCACYADGTEFTSSDRMLNYGTTYHASGQLLFILPLLRGGSQVLLNWFDPAVAMDIIEREQITVTWGFDVHYLMMRRHPSFGSRDISSLRCVLVGSDPVTYAEIAELGVPSHANIYGSSEYLSNLFPYRDRLDRRRMRESHGRPMESVQQKIVDPVTGEMVPAGTIGEICVKGPGLFKGYYKMPDQTAAAIDADGYFHTGDLGYVDVAGYTYFRGRLKDTVKSGGENVSAREVELFLQTETPYVRVAQVFGVPDPKWGEAVTALVELREGIEVTEQQLRDFCRGKIAGYKIPKHFVFVRAEDWLITPTGKYDKQAMRSRTVALLQADAAAK